MALSSAIPAARISRVLGILVEFKDLRSGASLFLPPRIAVLAQGNTASVFSSDKLTLTGGAGQAAEVYGYGSPIHTIVQRLLPATGDGSGATPITIYPLDDGGVVAEGAITPVGVPTKDFVAVIKVGGRASVNIVIPSGSTLPAMAALMVAGVAAVLDMPVLAVVNVNDCEFDAKWKGETGNDLTIEIEGGADAGTTFVITPMASGAGNPTVDAPLLQMGNVWETLIINGLNYDDTTALAAIQAHGDGRWGSLSHNPYYALSTAVETDVGVMVTAGNLRKSDKVNVVLHVPGAKDMPWEYTARAAVRITNRAGSNPATDYARQALTLLRPGLETEQADVNQRELLVQAGISTTELVSGVVELSDTITYYHPDAEPIPGYRFVVDLTKLQNIIFNIRIEFIKEEWDGAPLLKDDDDTNNPKAKKPKMAIGALKAIARALVLDAICADLKTIQDGIDANINGSNPKRLDMLFPSILSGNTNQRAVDLNFGFNFAA